VLSVLGRRTWAALLACLVFAGAALALVVVNRGGDKEPGLPAAPSRYDGTLTDPIDPRQFTAVPWESRSHWLQPWRAYLDTVPASRLLSAIGINFNVDPAEADGTARLLAANGFRRARVELSWDHLDFDDPAKLADSDATTLLQALKRHGIRPLILLNANQGAPGPIKALDVTVTQPATQGARELVLDKASAAQVVPGHTGLNALSGPAKAANVIFTSVSPDGKVQLSKPLPQALQPGAYHASTLKYEPFGPPKLADGKPNPKFEQTLAGWLRYVSTVTRTAKSIMGGENFDVEVWNELSFGSGFLDQANYYDPPRESGTGDVTAELLGRTVAWIRDPAHGVSHIGITDGFASQTPFPAGSVEPPGLTAMSKHPYKGLQHFPAQALYNNIKPVDALGKPSYNELDGARRDTFVPTYDALFPEYFLTAIQTETMVRDLAPWNTKIAGFVHGRNAHPPGAPAPQIWLTETGIDPSGADPSVPGNSGRPKLSPADVAHLHAKTTLRTFVAYVNKGVGAVYPYAVQGTNLSLVDPNFLEKLGQGYPGDHAGGPTMDAVSRLVAAFAGSQPKPRVSPLSLVSVAQEGNHAQFQGDGTAAHPTLFDRDVLAFLPFEVRPGRYVVPVYVMTRDITKLYRPQAPASDVTRFDLPPEIFALTIGGIPPNARVSATDPLTGAQVPVHVDSRSGSRIVVRMPVTDSPRLLTIQG
jgi:hypothetical protein